MVGAPFLDDRETKRIRTGLEADHQLATFLNDLRPRSLETFEIISYSNIGAESFLALNCHRESLTELKINNVKPEAMPALSMLKGCTSLTTLLLTETTGTTDLEKTQHDVFLEIIAWLLECKSLENVTFRKFLSAPAIMTPLLLENDIHLNKLEIEGYVMKDSREFHQALAHQGTLQRVWLKGDGEEVMRDDLDTLVDALSTLHHLRDLRLRDVSDYFKDEHICQLARSLPELEEFFTSGYGITDAIWTDVASLKVLRRLDLNAMTRFTLDGILDFISNLGDGNRGLLLAVMMADADSNLTEEEQSLIQETMAAKVEGRFEFTLMRGNSYSLHQRDNEAYTDATVRSRRVRIRRGVRLGHSAFERITIYGCPGVQRSIGRSRRRSTSDPFIKKRLGKRRSCHTTKELSSLLNDVDS